MDFQKGIELLKSKKEISIFAGIAIVSLLALFINGAKSDDKPRASEIVQSMDTYIPEGYSLLPIEVANYETLDSLLGSFGVVDLYTVPQGPADKSQRVGYRLKIMRAPRNPSHFAVLVPFEKVKSILKFNGPFVVSVQNPKGPGTAFVKEETKKKSRIQYNLGE